MRKKRGEKKNAAVATERTQRNGTKERKKERNKTDERGRKR